MKERRKRRRNTPKRREQTRGDGSVRPFGIGIPSHRELLEAIFRTAIVKGTLDTGIFGLRLQRHSFDFFIKQLLLLYPAHSNCVERFQAAFGQTLFVHLTRRDKVAQAVSYVKARQTGLWHAAPDGTELERLSPPQKPAYDAGEIRAWVEENDSPRRRLGTLVRRVGD